VSDWAGYLRFLCFLKQGESTSGLQSGEYDACQEASERCVGYQARCECYLVMQIEQVRSVLLTHSKLEAMCDSLTTHLVRLLRSKEAFVIPQRSAGSAGPLTHAIMQAAETSPSYR